MRLTSTTSTLRVANERGTAMVEFALLLPLLMMLVFGIIQFGRAYNAKIELTGAVREGARAAALGKTDDEVQATVVAAAPAVSLAAGDIKVEFFDDDDVSHEVLLADCDNGASAFVTAGNATEYTIPFIPKGFGPISAIGVMRCGL